MIQPESIRLENLPSVYFKNKSDLPSCPGVYFVRDKNNTVQYIGYSVNINKRWLYHHREADIESLSDPVISWIAVDTSDKQTLLNLEIQFIHHFKPKLNNKIIKLKKINTEKAASKNVRKNIKGLFQINIGSVDLSTDEIDLLKVAASLSKISIRQFIREIVLDHLKTYRFHYQYQVKYVARKYGLSSKEAFEKLKTQQPPFGETVNLSPVFEKPLSKEKELNNLKILLANCGIEDDGKNLLGSFADMY